MTEEQIQQAQQALNDRNAVTGQDANPQLPTSQPDRPNGLLTLLIAPVAGYLVAFTTTTWFDLSLVGLAVLAIVVAALLSKRFVAGFTGLLGLTLFVGVASAYRLQDNPVVAQYATPYIAMIDADYLCKAVICQRTGSTIADSKEGIITRQVPIDRVAQGSADSNPVAGFSAGQSRASEQKAAAAAQLEADRAAAAALEQQRLAEDERQRQLAEVQRQHQLAEQQRLADAKRREREAEEARDRNYRAAISNFAFPSSNCTRPAVPSTDASDYVLTRFDNAAADYSDCVSNAISRDERAAASLVEQLDGDFAAVDGGYSVNVWQRFSEPVQHVIDSLVERNERRAHRHNELADAIDRRNEQVTREEYWAGLQESVDRFEYDMERQRQRSWDSWSSNNVYVSPGYN